MIANGRGMCLAPFYDLMCTRAYAGLGPNFAFSIAGETDPGKLTSEHFVELAKLLGIGPKYLQKQAHEMALAVEAAIPAAAAEVLPLLAINQHVLVERIVCKIASLTRKMRRRVAGNADAPEDRELAP